MFVFDRVSKDSDPSLPNTPARSPANRAGAPRYHQTTRFEVKELGEINMASTAHLADAFRELLG
ncbi:MAG TPA: hypothetical protein VI365_32505 [Trebonia sp.]